MNTEQLMKKLHASLCPDKLEAEIRAKFMELEAEIQRLGRLSVENIMVDIVPGEDGGGHEIFAKSVSDVVALLSDMVQRAEYYAGESSTAHSHIDQYVTALAECRDAFPVPTAGSRMDDWYCSAMADPLEIPEYVKICVDSKSGTNNEQM